MVGLRNVRRDRRGLGRRRLLALVFQALLLIAVLGLGYEIVGNAIANLKAQKVASGFGFLETTAGFGIIQTLIPYDESASYGRAFIVGLLNTLLVAVIGIFFATLLGFAIGIARLSRNWLIARLASFYIETIRNIPLLLQIFFWYFGVLRQLPVPREGYVFWGEIHLNNRGLFLPWPQFEAAGWVLVIGVTIAALIALLAGRRLWRRDGQKRWRAGVWLLVPLTLSALAIAAAAGGLLVWDTPALKGFNVRGGLKIIPELVALVLALSIYTAAFIAEIVRAGILAVDRGQGEAAQALGLSRWQSLKLVVIPQALRIIVPPLTNQYLNLTKNSSLAVAIAYPDLVSVFTGIVLNHTGQAVEIMLMTMAVYLTLSLLTAGAMNLYNARQAPAGS